MTGMATTSQQVQKSTIQHSFVKAMAVVDLLTCGFVKLFSSHHHVLLAAAAGDDDLA
jgi:hypothetical protein